MKRESLPGLPSVRTCLELISFLSCSVGRCVSERRGGRRRGTGRREGATGEEVASFLSLQGKSPNIRLTHGGDKTPICP